jgi:hypothetical protein
MQLVRHQRRQAFGQALRQVRLRRVDVELHRRRAEGTAAEAPAGDGALGVGDQRDGDARHRQGLRGTRDGVGGQGLRRRGLGTEQAVRVGQPHAVRSADRGRLVATPAAAAGQRGRRSPHGRKAGTTPPAVHA